MKPEIAKALSDHLDKRNQEKADAAVRASERERQIEKNVADFEVTVNAIIGPALQEIVDLYQEKGVAVRIDIQREVVDRTGGIRPANIGIDMAAAYPWSEMKPGFKFTFEKENRTLSLYTCTGSTAGPGGSVSLDDITAEWIHSRFAKYQGIEDGHS